MGAIRSENVGTQQEQHQVSPSCNTLWVTGSFRNKQKQRINLFKVFKNFRNFFVFQVREK